MFGSLFTSDPGDIHKTIESLVKDNIKVSVIGLSAQVAICQELVNRTNNEPRNSSSKHYGVIMNETHFKELLMDCVTPLPLPESEETKVETKGVPLIKMGFPSKVQPNATSTIGNSEYTVEFPRLNASYPTQGSNDSRDIVEVNAGLVTSHPLATNVHNAKVKCAIYLRFARSADLCLYYLPIWRDHTTTWCLLPLIRKYPYHLHTTPTFATDVN